MSFDLWSAYREMLRSRIFEEVVTSLWEQGLIYGEMHLGAGEEAIAAGVVLQMQEGDAMSLDHRGTPALLMRGVDMVLLLNEFLGRPDGLCHGYGGHMHLFSPEHLAASTGIVGAPAPAAAGFALAARFLRPGKLSVAFFGEGAINEGVLMESLNLAAVWRLPVLFVCKDNNWSIFTRSETVTAGHLPDRARCFGIPVTEVDGTRVEDVYEAANQAFTKIRNGEGPIFLYGRCVHLQGHLLDDPLVDLARHPLQEPKRIVLPVIKSALRLRGAPILKRIRGLTSSLELISQAAKSDSVKNMDPVVITRAQLLHDPTRLENLEYEVMREINSALDSSLASLEPA